MSYQVMWDNGWVCRAFPWTFATEVEAEACCNAWVEAMQAFDPDGKYGADPQIVDPHLHWSSWSAWSDSAWHEWAEDAGKYRGDFGPLENYLP